MTERKIIPIKGGDFETHIPKDKKAISLSDWFDALHNCSKKTDAKDSKIHAIILASYLPQILESKDGFIYIPNKTYDYIKKKKLTTGCYSRWMGFDGATYMQPHHWFMGLIFFTRIKPRKGMTEQLISIFYQILDPKRTTVTMTWGHLYTHGYDCKKTYSWLRKHDKIPVAKVNPSENYYILLN